MINTLDIFCAEPNTVVLKNTVVISINTNSLEECAELIRNNEYSLNYDLNGDGYLTAADYDLLYNLFYNKWESWQSKTFDIRALVRINRYISGLTPIDLSYDLDNDSIITNTDAVIARRWLLRGKTEKETINA